jgi:TldD protein
LKTLMTHALDFAELRGAQYVDIRVVDAQNETISIKNGVVQQLDFTDTIGFGVRVLVNGAWGFASSRELSSEEVERITAMAFEIAKASALTSGGKVDLGSPVTSTGSYVTPYEIDPFSVSLEDKLDLLLAADAELDKVEGPRIRTADMRFWRTKKYFANAEGAYTEQTIIESGGGISATAVAQGEVQVRSFPNSFRGQFSTGGYEVVKNLDLVGNAYRVASEAVELLSADTCPQDTVTDIILGGSQLALQIHESCGHPTELDRVYGTEAAYAGTSFLTTEKLNNFQYGSEIVNLTQDSVTHLGLGTAGWDDEGIPAQTTHLVKDGQFVGYLMGREDAAKLGLESNGCARATNWNRIPLVRMTNVSLQPGTWTFDDMVADTDDGIYMETNRSWSIDDKRYNFQFGTEVGYEIKNGQLGRLLKNCTYTGITPEFWRSCDAIGNADHWNMWGTPNCGKGQPSQVAHTGHGAAPSRFRKVRVGVMK